MAFGRAKNAGTAAGRTLEVVLSRYCRDRPKHAIMPAIDLDGNRQSQEMIMQLKALLASTSLVGALAWMPLLPAQAQTAVALSGQVSSAEEGSMEGVLVSARKEGSTITVTVVTDATGQYRFPADRLDAGHYAIAIRAAGYNLDGPKALDVAAGGFKADIKLVKTKNLANQLYPDLLKSWENFLAFCGSVDSDGA